MDRGFVRAVFVCTGLLSVWLRGADSASQPSVPPPLLLEGGAEFPARAVMPERDPSTALDRVVPVRRVGVTPELTRSVQQFYLTRLRNEASSAVRLEFDGLRWAALRQGAEPADEFALNARLIAWLLARLQPRDRARIEAVNARIGAACATSSRLPSACRDDSSLDRQKEPS